MDDRLVNRAPGGAEIGELRVAAVALQQITRRDRLPADLIGRRALEDCPVHPARLAFFFDIIETAVNNRVERIELGRGPAVGCPAAASRRPAATALTLSATPLAAAILSPGAVPPIALTAFVRTRAAGARLAGPCLAYRRLRLLRSRRAFHRQPRPIRAAAPGERGGAGANCASAAPVAAIRLPRCSFPWRRYRPGCPPQRLRPRAFPSPDAPHPGHRDEAARNRGPHPPRQPAFPPGRSRSPPAPPPPAPPP